MRNTVRDLIEILADIDSDVEIELDGHSLTLAWNGTVTPWPASEGQCLTDSTGRIHELPGKPAMLLLNGI